MDSQKIIIESDIMALCRGIIVGKVSYSSGEGLRKEKIRVAVEESKDFECGMGLTRNK